MKSRAEAEEYAVKTRMALAEVGYGGHYVVVKPPRNDGNPLFVDEWSVGVSLFVPLEVTWRVARVVGRPVPCLRCFSHDFYDTAACLDPSAADCGLR